MQRPTWATRPVLVVAAAVLLALAVVAVVLLRSGSTKPDHIASEVRAKISAGGGVTLSAEVISPAGSGPFPWS